MLKKHSQAFSLVEISTVVIIITLLIAAISGARPMIELFKFRTAQNLTKSSPVLAIGADGSLKLWLESSLDDSIIKDSSNAVSKWIDRSGKNNNATVAAINEEPIYTENSINSIPALKFDGTNDHLDLPDGTVPPGNQDYTIFIVAKRLNDGVGGLIGSGDQSSTGTANFLRFQTTTYKISNIWQLSDAQTDNNSALANIPYIITALYEKNASGNKRYIYINGITQNLSADATKTDRNSKITTNRIGTDNGTDFLDGYIAEIIIYNRALYDDEKEAIEKYLSKKYSIKLTN